MLGLWPRMALARPKWGKNSESKTCCVSISASQDMTRSLKAGCESKHGWLAKSVRLSAGLKSQTHSRVLEHFPIIRPCGIV